MTTEVPYSGLMLSKPPDISIEQARAGWKAGILNEYEKQGKKPVEGEPFITIPMPCGEVVEYQTFEDIPGEDVPCPCGNKNHKIVMYTTVVKMSGN